MSINYSISCSCERKQQLGMLCFIEASGFHSQKFSHCFVAAHETFTAALSIQQPFPSSALSLCHAAHSFFACTAVKSIFLNPLEPNSGIYFILCVCYISHQSICSCRDLLRYLNQSKFFMYAKKIARVNQIKNKLRIEKFLLKEKNIF